jgi:elongation factor Ts
MPEVTAKLVKQLRDATNVSMMECKHALVEAQGDLEKATRLLRERGIAVAAKKATRAANQGLIASATGADGAVSLIEVNCETDFVARNAAFQGFVADLARKACETDAPLAEALRDTVTAKVAEIGENIVIRRNIRYIPEGTGRIGSYIHLGGKVGVLIDVGCGKPETADNPVFEELVKDLTLHVAACNPRYRVSDDVPEAEIASEREIFAKQVEGKPARIIDKIVAGKVQKYFTEICLVDREFVKEQKLSVGALLAGKGKELDDTLTIRRFVRYQLGE